jgi:hypothetical protein
VLRTHAAVIATATAVLLTACGGATTPSPTTVTVQTPAPPTSTAEQPAAAVPAGPTSWTMPGMVRSNLQEAQDAIQRMTDFAIPITYSHDETGAGRSRVLDRNWKVCSQAPEAGTTISQTTRIEFGAVKLEEDC